MESRDMKKYQLDINNALTQKLKEFLEDTKDFYSKVQNGGNEDTEKLIEDIEKIKKILEKRKVMIEMINEQTQIECCGLFE